MSHRFKVSATEERRKGQLPQVEYKFYPLGKDVTPTEREISSKSYDSLRNLGKALASLDYCILERAIFPEFLVIDPNLNPKWKLFLHKRPLTDNEFRTLEDYIYRYSDKTSWAYREATGKNKDVY